MSLTKVKDYILTGLGYEGEKFKAILIIVFQEISPVGHPRASAAQINKQKMKKA